MRVSRFIPAIAATFLVIAVAGGRPESVRADNSEAAADEDTVRNEPETVTVEFEALSTQVTRTDSGFIKVYRGDVNMRVNPEVWLTAEQAVYSTVAHLARLTGGVTAFDSGRTLRAESVVYLFEEHPHTDGRAVVKLRRNVMVNDSARTITAFTIDYWPDSDSVAARGFVRVRMSGGSLRSDTLAYDARTGDMSLRGSVVLIDSTQDITIRSGRYEYSSSDSVALISEWPVLTKGHGDTAVTVSADYMSYDEISGRAVAWDSVFIERSGLVARADSVIYDETAERLLLYGNPRAVQTAKSDTGETVSETVGDHIVLQLDGSNVRKIRIYGTNRIDARALAIESDSSGETSGERWITGREIVFHIDGERIDRLDIYGQARSRVVPRREARLSEGINEASGDTMTITFSGNRMDRVQLWGGVLGTYWPPTDSSTSADADSATTDSAAVEQGVAGGGG